MTARLPPASATIKKPVPYQPASLPPSNQMSRTIEKRLSVSSEKEDPTSLGKAPSLSNVASLVNQFKNQTTNSNPPESLRASRTSSVSSNQTAVSELVRIYSEAQGAKQQKSRSASVASTVKNDESIRSIDQARNLSLPRSGTPGLRTPIQQHRSDLEENHLDGATTE